MSISDTHSEKESWLDHTTQVFTLPSDQHPERLDKVLARLMPEHSRSRLQAWIKQGHVQVNNHVANVRQTMHPCDVIAVSPQPDPESLAYQAEYLPLEVLAQSQQWLVLNKPAGVVVHPGAGNWHGTLLNGLLYAYPELETVPRAGIVHRLDKDTSGALVVARSLQAHTHLVRQLQARRVTRRYHAWVHGRVLTGGEQEQAIGRDRRVPVRMTTDNPIAPKAALTYYEPLTHATSTNGHPLTELRCQLHTGRTHQIRVHLAALGHPIVGDTMYGGRLIAGCERQMLHARYLSFVDPGTDRSVDFTAPWPQDFLYLQRMATGEAPHDD